jgi:hypothetical protein
MRPDLGDVLAGVQRLLSDEIYPALAASPYQQEQLTFASLLLELVKNSWARAHLAIAAEHGDLRATLSRVAECLAPVAGGELETFARSVREKLADTPASVVQHPLDEILAAGRTLREAVSAGVVLLDAQDAAGAADEAPRARARAEIDAYLCRFAERESAWVGGLGLGW